MHNKLRTFAFAKRNNFVLCRKTAMPSRRLADRYGELLPRCVVCLSVVVHNACIVAKR